MITAFETTKAVQNAAVWRVGIHGHCQTRSQVALAIKSVIA